MALQAAEAYAFTREPGTANTETFKDIFWLL